MTPTAFKFLGAAILVAAVLQGCSPMQTASQGASPPPSLNDTAWTLASLPGTTLLPAPQATLQFEGGRAAGSDGCNRYGTRFTAADGKLELGPQRVSTQMACPEPVSQLAAAFNRVLDDVRAYRIEAGSLLLLNASGATLATLAAQANTLAGTAWQVSGYNNGKQAVVSVITGTQLTMEFLADGKLRGSGGCNNFQRQFHRRGQPAAHRPRGEHADGLRAARGPHGTGGRVPGRAGNRGHCAARGRPAGTAHRERRTRGVGATGRAGEALSGAAQPGRSVAMRR